MRGERVIYAWRRNLEGVKNPATAEKEKGVAPEAVQV